MTDERPLEEKRATGIASYKSDPWPYGWVASSVAYVLELCGQYPEYFPIEEGVAICCKFMQATKSQMCYIDPIVWDRSLRQSVLKRLKVLCDSCQQCELAQNRIPGRGCSFGEGDVDADLMLLGEGPGAFEQATEGVFVDVEVLKSSTCATKCEHFERCYVGRDDTWNEHRRGECDYTPINVDEDRMKARLRNRKNNTLATTGQILGTVLQKQRIFRKPFVQVLKMKEDLGLVPLGKYKIASSLYITNAIRCRCTKLDDNGYIKDDKPKPAHIAACAPWLEMTRHLVKPRQMVAVGNPAIHALHPELPRGWTITKACDPTNPETPTIQLANGKVAFVLLHPSYISRMLGHAGQNTYDALLEKFSLTLREAQDKVNAEKETERTQSEEAQASITSRDTNMA